MVNKMEIKGKTALVTGGASGIGLACVRELLKHGAQVAVCDYDVVKGETVLAELKSEFGPESVIFIKTDVRNEAEFEDAFKVTISTFKALDIVLNNAGLCDLQDWEKTIAINFNAVVRGTQLAFKFMGKNNGGRGGILCNTASVLGMRPMTTMPVYSATKHAIIGLTRSYGERFHLERSGVRVAAMCPGLTATAFMSNLAVKSKMDQDYADQLKKDVAGSMPQKPENVAAGVMVLLQTAESGSIWVSEDGEPVYEVEIPEYQTMRKK